MTFPYAPPSGSPDVQSLFAAVMSMLRGRGGQYGAAANPLAGGAGPAAGLGSVHDVAGRLGGVLPGPQGQVASVFGGIHPPGAAAPPVQHPVGGGPMDAGDGSGVRPGAVIAVNTPNGPIYYGTPQWEFYKMTHGMAPPPRLASPPHSSPGGSQFLAALLSRFGQRPGGTGHALGAGPVID
jgi:hypothetical protein